MRSSFVLFLYCLTASVLIDDVKPSEMIWRSADLRWETKSSVANSSAAAAVKNRSGNCQQLAGAWYWESVYAAGPGSDCINSFYYTYTFEDLDGNGEYGTFIMSEDRKCAYPGCPPLPCTDMGCGCCDWCEQDGFGTCQDSSLSLTCANGEPGTGIVSADTLVFTCGDMDTRTLVRTCESGSCP